MSLHISHQIYFAKSAMCKDNVDVVSHMFFDLVAYYVYYREVNIKSNRLRCNDEYERVGVTTYLPEQRFFK